MSDKLRFHFPLSASLQGGDAILPAAEESRMRLAARLSSGNSMEGIMQSFRRFSVGVSPLALWLGFLALEINAQPLTEPLRQPAQAVPLSWRATARDGISTTHEATQTATNAITGEVTNRVHRYVEVSSGLNYVNEAGQWIESQDLVELTADGGAAAVHGPTKVYFKPNLNSAGAITFTTRSNRVIRTHPLCLAYYDASSGKSVVLSRLKDCAGELLPPNQIVYKSAFGSLADVRYTYTKAAFESDIILLEQPPAPELYGLDPRTTRLEVWHGWLNAPEPRVTHRMLARETDPVARARMVEPDFTDQILNFDGLWFPTGGAYVTDGSSTRTTNTPAQLRVRNIGREAGVVAVGKTWQATPQGDFLIESVRWSDVQPTLASLPPSRTSAPDTTPHDRTLRLSQMTPPAAARPTDAPVRVATSDYRPTGCVLDYIEVTGSGSYTFEPNTTYLVGSTYFDGTVTIRPGAVLKYSDWVHPPAAHA